MSILWQYEMQKDRTLKDELLRSVDAQYAIGDQWRNNSRKNEGKKPQNLKSEVVKKAWKRTLFQDGYEQEKVSLVEGQIQRVLIQGL